MPDDLVTDAAEAAYESLLAEATLAIAERLDYELRGAWRAGYDYVHVYGESPGRRRAADLGEQLTVRQYVLPSDQRQPPRPETRNYRYTYDLTSVDDDEIRAAIRDD